MVALAVTSSVLLTKSFESGSSVAILHEAPIYGLMYSPSEVKLGFENLTRSVQNIISPFNKINDDSYYELVEKFHSTFTKVSFRYLSFLHFFQCGEGTLFLELRRILI